MKATEKTFNGLRISGFLALFLILALSGLCCYLIAGINDTWSVITGIVGLCLLVVFYWDSWKSNPTMPE